MEGNNFKDHLLKILSATGYGLNFKPDQLIVHDNDPKLKQFYQWFCSNITKENCLTIDELSEFQRLEKSNEVLYGEELDEAVQSHFSPSSHLLASMAESTLEAKKDELYELQQQFSVKTQLLSTVNASVSAVSEDINKISQQKKEAEDWNTKCATNVLCVKEQFNEKLDYVKDTLESGRKKFSSLVLKNELSADEGIDTLASDNLDASNVSTLSISTVSSLASHSEMTSNHKFFCQIPFEQYGKQEQRYSKVIGKLLHANKVQKKKADNDLDTILELQNIQDRLMNQKKSLILNAAEIEGLKAAQQKIDDIIQEIQRGRGKKVLSKIKNDFFESKENSESDDSFLKETEDLDDACKTWAESRILQPSLELQQQELEDYKVLINQLDELKKDLKLKLAADRIFCEVLLLEEEEVEHFFEIHRRLDNVMREKVEGAKKRMEIMQENLQDYRDYQSLPVEDRYEPIEWLAAMLGSEKKSLVEAINELNENLESQHKMLTEHLQQNMQILINENQQLTKCYNSEIRNKELSQTTRNTNLELYQTIQTHLNVMDDLIEETNLNLNPNQLPQAYQDEESDVEKLLQERVIQLKKQ